MLKTRKTAFFSLLIATLSVAAFLSPVIGAQDGDVLSRDRVLRDPEIPVAGNPKGDITVVEFFDYQCPYCKEMHSELTKALKEDGNVRVIYKNWPVFGGVSIYAARMALAAKYQNKYAEAHEALITAPTKLDESRVRERLQAAGVNVDQATKDMDKNAKTIDNALARTNEQAEAFGFQGTPSFIFDSFRYSGVLDAEAFKAAFADARKAGKDKK